MGPAAAPRFFRFRDTLSVRIGTSSASAQSSVPRGPALAVLAWDVAIPSIERACTPPDEEGAAIDRLGVRTSTIRHAGSRAEALEIVKPYVLGPIFTPPSVAAPGHPITLPGTAGGGNWNGGAFETGIFYVASHTHTWVSDLVRGQAAAHGSCVATALETRCARRVDAEPRSSTAGQTAPLRLREGVSRIRSRQAQTPWHRPGFVRGHRRRAKLAKALGRRDGSPERWPL